MALHRERRTAILAAHPEVRLLEGSEWSSKWIASALVVAQVALACWTADWEWGLAYAAVVYALGATIAQALFLANHELTHGLFFDRPSYNRAFSLIVNWPALVPYAASFRSYHLEHHAHQGRPGVDTDLPSEWEVRLVRGVPLKLAWLSLQLVFYAVRPLVTRPRAPGLAEAANAASQLAFVACLWTVAGSGAIVFLFCSLLVSGGLHPCAGHFLSEHYIFQAPRIRKREIDRRLKSFRREAAMEHDTFSYYGPLNRLTWMVGYHNEHHDLPRVPWSRLRQVRATAPEFYDDLPSCPSWSGALWRFVVDPRIDLSARLRRPEASDECVKKVE